MPGDRPVAVGRVAEERVVPVARMVPEARSAPEDAPTDRVARTWREHRLREGVSVSHRLLGAEQSLLLWIERTGRRPVRVQLLLFLRLSYRIERGELNAIDSLGAVTSTTRTGSLANVLPTSIPPAKYAPVSESGRMS